MPSATTDAPFSFPTINKSQLPNGLAVWSVRHGAVPVFVALDNVTEPPSAPVPALGAAKKAGLLVFDLFDLWQGRDESSLRIAEWDSHPNTAGNRIIADRLVELVRQHRAELRLPLPPQ